jgi:class 3 adenylate cyclase/predicted ATPase
MAEIENLEQGIAALEAQRAMLGDAVVDAMLAPVREKLALLRANVQSAPAALSEQRKQVTVLFADLSGFTALTEHLDAEEVRDKMNAFWTRLDRVITTQGGVVDKHIGDAVMALFGVPAAREDDPERGIRAALDVQKEVHAFAVAHPDFPLQMRIGLNTGPVLLGDVGSRREFTAMGDTVNLASRLERAAPVGGVLISHDTYRHVRGVFDTQAQPPLTVKGKAEPVQTYLVMQAKPRAFRLYTRGVEGVETRMVGRQAELDRLKDAMQAVIEQRTLQAITVSGEGGLGKSRLLYEFSAWAELLSENWRIFQGRASEATRQLPYALLRDVFAFRFEMAESDPLAVAREKLEQGIVRFMAEDADAVMKAHFIGHLIGLDFSESPHLRGILHDVKQIRDRAFHYLLHFFAAVTREAGLAATVLLLEDLHWADDGSLDALAYVVQNGQNLPLLILGLARPVLFERRPEWMAAQTRIELQPLSPLESSWLVDEILKKAAEVPPALRKLVAGRAEGNPFYVEELIKMLIDEQAILPGDDQWRVVPARLVAVRIPATLTGILQTRLDGLPAPEREAVQCAAVVGRVFWVSAVEFLAQVSGPPTPGSESGGDIFRTLQRRELVYRREMSAFAGTDEYIFKHALLRDVAYETVLKRLRHTYHELAAAWLIEQSGERVYEYAGLIAEHYERSGERLQAAEWYGRAGNQAAATYAPETALGYFQKALELSQSLPLADARKVGGADIHLKLGGVLELLGQWEEAEAHARAALALAEQAEEAVTIAVCQKTLGHLVMLRGDYAAGLRWLEQARAGWAMLGDRAGLSQALIEIGIVFYRQGEYGAARRHLEEGLALARATNDKQGTGLALNNLGNVASDQGDNLAARALYEESLALKRELGDKRGIAGSLNNLGNVVSDQGDNAAARVLYEECLAQLREIGDKAGIARALNNLGIVALEQGEGTAAQVLHEESLAIKRGMGDKPGIAMSLNNLGIVAAELNDYAKAQAYYEESLKLAQEIGDKHTLIYNLVGLAEAATPPGSGPVGEGGAWRTARLAAAAETHLNSIGATMEPTVQRQFTRAVSRSKAGLSAAAFAAAWAEGQALTTEAAIAYALQMGQ